MKTIQTLITTLAHEISHARVADVRIGAFWTAVALQRAGGTHVGLASAFRGFKSDGAADHHHGKRRPVQNPGNLLDYDVASLAELAFSDSLTETSVGLATINALLDVDVNACEEVNAADIIAEHGARRNVTVVGHFPFIKNVREVAQKLWVLELEPRDGDLPASEAANVLPQSDVVAITGTTLLNGTFESLIAHCHPDAFIIMLGATAPMSSVILDAGVDAVAGTLIVDAKAVLNAVSQGAIYPQIPGKRLLTLFRK